MKSHDPTPRCRNCDGALIRRNPVWLFAVGALLCGSLAVAFFLPLFWAPAIVLFLAGAYLIAWATLAGGSWCRNCKTFRV